MVPDDPALGQIVTRIAAGLPVQRIILFGSRARGDAGPDSDYDLAVVWDCPLQRLDRSLAVLRLLRGLPQPIDILPLTPEELRTGAGLRRPVWEDVRGNGVTVYEAGVQAA